MFRKLSKKLRKFSKRKTKPKQNNINIHSKSTSVNESKNAQCVNKQQYEGKLRYFSIKIVKYRACFRFRSHFKRILLLFGFNKYSF